MWNMKDEIHFGFTLASVLNSVNKILYSAVEIQIATFLRIPQIQN